MKLNIGYFADGPWSHEAFEKLINDSEITISFICVRFDTKDLTLKHYSEKYNIEYLKHENINSDEFISIVKKYNCDLFVSMSFNQIFRSVIINLPKYKTMIRILVNDGIHVIDIFVCRTVSAVFGCEIGAVHLLVVSQPGIIVGRGFCECQRYIE